MPSTGETKRQQNLRRYLRMTPQERAANVAKNREKRAERREAAVVPPGVPHGSASTYQYWGCRCAECRAAKQEALKPYKNKSFYKLQAQSQASASRNGFEWTGPELEIADRRELTAATVAMMLGRTVAAVNSVRSRIDKRDPRTLFLLGSPLGDDR